MSRFNFIWTLRLCIALFITSALPIEPSQAFVFAQSKKKDPAQATKYAKRGSAKAKKKDYRGALADYKRAYQLNPNANYKKRVQQLTSLAKKQSGSKSGGSKVSKKRAAQAAQYAKRANAKAKKKDYAGALKDYQRAAKLNPTAANQKRVKQLANIVKKSGSAPKRRTAKATMPKVSNIPTISPVKYANDIYNIAEGFEMSTRNLARATSILEEKQSKKVEFVNLQKTPTTSELENAARLEPNDFRKQVDLARNYEANGRVNDSKEIYLKLAAQNPRNADAHFHLGSYYARFDQLTKARHAFDEALDAQPNHRATIEAMATIFGQNEKRTFSDDILAKSAQKDPTGPAQQISKIRKNLDEFNYEYAARLAQTGQDLFPKQGAFILLKGKAFEGMGDLEKAKASYQESIQNDPRHGESYIALGDLYSGQGKHLYAALTYSDAVRLDPSNEDIRYKQGLGYFKANEWGRAASAWEDLLYYDPKNQKVNLLLPQTYYILAVEYNRSGQSSLGQTAFRKAININRNSAAWLPGSMRTLGGFYREKGMYKESLAAYQEAIELRPADSETYLGLGITYWKMKEEALAKAAWSKSMELDPTNNDARGWLMLSGKISG
ncbi:MAG: tetratricopeptide repeat protein [Candidatus Neomarinimicrobiota bacterium]|nr:tetratricopeptide repeat protein [Candidatus Neomarinimicrobiota bacterium]